MSSTIVFVHGNFVTRHCWDAWVDRYSARGYRCVAVAYPGRDRPVEELRRNPDRRLLRDLTLARVVQHHADIISSLPEKPIIIGHSFGGLVTQLLVQRDLAAAAVAIDSVPPQGVLSARGSFYRSTWPALNPFVPASRPYLMSFEHFQYTFVNGLPLAEQRAAYEREVVPESRRLARGGISGAARVDFARPHAPLLLIGGETDNIMPAELNRRNYRRYARSPSAAEYREFLGRNHYTIIAGRGWEEVGDFAVDWAARATGSVPVPRARPA